MNHEGPPLELLLRRVAETPPDFLAEPRTCSGRGLVHVAAVACDTALLLGHPRPDAADFVPEDRPVSIRTAGVAALLCWLITEPSLRAVRPTAKAVSGLLVSGAAELGAHLGAAKYVGDPDRREELVRFALAALGLRPRGETVAQAQDRLSALNSAERLRVVAAAREAEARARQIREALARKAAMESADKYTRE
jgi:hypothetical protein